MSDALRIHDLLLSLEAELQREVLRLRDAAVEDAAAESLRAPVREGRDDVLYAIDVRIEDVVLEWLDSHWPNDLPVELVMEGLERETVFPVGCGSSDARHRLIIDPIDGTRGFMFDKRSAWVLAAVAPRIEDPPRLSHVEVAAMTELPPSKQRLADRMSAVRGGGLRAERVDLERGTHAVLALRPSSATTLAHGFAPFARYFAEGTPEIAALQQRVVRTLEAGQPVFDDQPLTSAGQFYALLTGQDRMCADLRPLFFPSEEASTLCHPYDVCVALLLEEAGCIVTDARGDALDPPLDTTTPVAWIGYANAALRAHVEPILLELLSERTR